MKDPIAKYDSVHRFFAAVDYAWTWFWASRGIELKYMASNARAAFRNVWRDKG